jgi:hypothetical protein
MSDKSFSFLVKEAFLLRFFYLSLFILLLPLFLSKS